MTNASNYRGRPLQPAYAHRWQASDESSKAADEIIEAPEKHLLTQAQLFEASGGHVGLLAQAGVVALGVAGVFAASPRMVSYLRSGSLRKMEWACLVGTGLSFNYLGEYLSRTFFGNPTAYWNHWAAYGFVKSCNRWEGRQILKNRPFAY